MDRISQLRKSLATEPPDHLPDDGGGGAGYPCLLNLQVYVADRRNATTASCGTEGGGGRRIQLTFCAAPPPQVSYLCICCPGLDPDVFAAPPYIVVSEGDILLLTVVFGQYSARSFPENYEYYVYRSAAAAAAGGAPSLQLIPRPHGPSLQVLSSNVTGILRYTTCSSTNIQDETTNIKDGGQDSYIIAAVSYTCSTNQFELHVYHSTTKSWSNKMVFRDNNREGQHFRLSHKVITIGGDAGTMAWVDLWNGILFYDLLRQDGDGVFGRYVPLPPTPLPSDQLDGCPLGERDIAFVKGRLRYIELQTHVRSSKSAIQKRTYISDGWTAFMWSRSAADPHPWEDDSWRLDCKLKASDVSVAEDNGLPSVESLPKLEDDGEAEFRSLLVRLHCGHPTLSLLDDQVFYLMNKIDFREKQAWVLAIDTRSKTLQAVAEFTADRIGGFSFTYRHSRLSEYLKMAPDTFQEVKSKRDKKKEVKETPEPRSRAANNATSRGVRGVPDRGGRNSSVYHSSIGVLQGDEELQAWYAAWWPKMQRGPELFKACTTIIWTAPSTTSSSTRSTSACSTLRGLPPEQAIGEPAGTPCHAAEGHRAGLGMHHYHLDDALAFDFEQ